jgi:hypothetical protein
MKIIDFLAAVVLAWSVIAVSGLTVKLLEKPKVPSQCPGLIATWQAVGLPTLKLNAWST